MSFVRVCDVADVPTDEGLRITVEGVEPIALFNVNGEFFAVQDTCTHGQWSLSEGFVEDYQVECTLHLARFCLRTGAVCAPPATAPLKTFAVRVDGSDVLIDPAVAAGAL